MNDKKIHESVMVREVIDSLHINKLGKTCLPAGRYIDATLGTAGHSLEIAKNGGLVLGIEADPKMLSLAKERLSDFSESKLVLGNFSDIKKIAIENDFSEVDGILFDLGVTNLHLTSDSRGFSFSIPENPLDMRLNPDTQGVKASDLLNMLRADQMEKMFEATMDLSSSRWMTKQVIEKRKSMKFETVADLLDICENLRSDKHSINKATLPFLALRIAVNSELDNLIEVLPKAYSLLKVGGKLLIITFHSGEEKIVKDFDKYSEVILPSQEEILKNPRARSAKLRVITKRKI